MLRDKHIIITGAAHGLGKALVRDVYTSKARVIAIDIDQEGLEKLKNEFKEVDIYCLDIGQKDQVTWTAKEILSNYQHLDGLINNAAVSHTGTVHELDLEDFEWVIRTNLMGTVHCTKCFLPGLLQSKDGFISIIASGIAFHGLPKFSAYASSKAAIKTFTESLRLEMKNHDISVSCVFPGPIKTNISNRARHVHQASFEKERDFLSSKGYDPDKFAKRILKGILQKKKNIFLGPEIWWGYHLKRLFPSLFEKMLLRFKHKLPV